MKKALIGMGILLTSTLGVAEVSIEPCFHLYCPKGCYVDENNQAHCCESAKKTSCLVESTERDTMGCPTVRKVSCYAHECCMPDGSCQAKLMKDVYKLDQEGKCILETVWYCPNEEPVDECGVPKKCEACNACETCDMNMGLCIPDVDQEGAPCGDGMLCQSGVCGTNTVIETTKEGENNEENVNL